MDSRTTRASPPPSPLLRGGGPPRPPQLRPAPGISAHTRTRTQARRRCCPPAAGTRPPPEPRGSPPRRWKQTPWKGCVRERLVGRGVLDVAVSRFTADARAAILDALRAGESVESACDAAGVARSTFQGWMRRGARPSERSGGGDYARFRAQVERAREDGASGPLTEDDVVRLLEQAARRGSVRACETLLKRFDAMRRPAVDPEWDAIYGCAPVERTWPPEEDA